MPDKKNLIKIGDLTKKIGFSAPWVYARTRLNMIPCVRIGRNLRFDLDDVLEWMRTEDTNLPKRIEK